MTRTPQARRAGDCLEIAPGVEIYCEDEGEGTPLVPVPGWTFTTRVFGHRFAEFPASHRNAILSEFLATIG